MTTSSLTYLIILRKGLSYSSAFFTKLKIHL